MFKLAKAIYPVGEQDTMNSFAAFRASVSDLSDARLYISASTFYHVYVNGSFAGFGPARTAKGYARVDIIDLSEYNRAGKNEIVITVAGYNCRSLSTVKSKPFLAAEVVCDGEVVCYTGRDFESFLPRCKVQKTERYSVQRHFSEVWDFREDPCLTSDTYRCRSEQISSPPHFLERIAPYPYYENIDLKSCTVKGNLQFNASAPYNRKFYSFQPSERWGRFDDSEILTKPYEWIQRNTQTVSSSCVGLPMRICENEYAIFDFSRIETGFIRFLADSYEESDIVIGFSEDSEADQFRFTDMHAHNVLEIFMDADSSQDFMSFEPYTAKYAIVAVRKGKIDLRGFGIKTFMYNISDVKIPPIEDSVLREIYISAVRTFAHNAVDLYSDCPSRERAGWLCDSYFTSKTEYALFHDTSIEDAFLENYRLYRNDGELPQGVIPMCYPSDITDDGKFIPQWTMWYIIEVEEYLNKRNTSVDREKFRESIYGLLEFYAKYENSDGLLEGLPSWNFVEWSRANDWTQDVSYPTNFLYAAALESAWKIYKDETLLRKCSEVRRKTVEQSFNGKVFLDHAVRDGNDLLVRCEDCSEACQYYAVLFGGIDLDCDRYSYLKYLIKEVFGPVRKEPIESITAINAFIGVYLRIEVLLRLGENELLLRDIKQLFGNMGRQTGTLWEYMQRHGSRDHGFASYAAVAIKKVVNLL